MVVSGSVTSRQVLLLALSRNYFDAIRHHSLKNILISRQTQLFSLVHISNYSVSLATSSYSEILSSFMKHSCEFRIHSQYLKNFQTWGLKFVTCY